jgi:trehalose 6-phosphate phosphatase
MEQALEGTVLGADCALFLDFDGTLVDIAPRPEAVFVQPSLVTLLQALQQHLAGALAIVSGRPLAELDQLLAPLKAPTAGVHGAQRRGADGALHQVVLPMLDSLASEADALALSTPGVLVERKAGALALHYREAPQWQKVVEAWMREAVHRCPGVELLFGKQVVEAKPAGATKGRAIRDFLREPPFTGRRPVFIGDDVTDESGFAEVQLVGGIGIKVGEGDTAAQHRLAGPAALRTWLQQQLDALGSPVAQAEKAV